MSWWEPLLVGGAELASKLLKKIKRQKPGPDVKPITPEDLRKKS